MKKKILHVLSSNDLAGAENVAMGIISLSSEEYECAYASPKGDIKTILEQREIQYLAMDKLSIAQTKKIIKSFQPTIIHAHDFTATIICLCSTWRIPVVSHIHQNPLWLRKVNKLSILYFLACIKLAAILAVSPAIKNTTFLSRLFSKKTVVLQNIISIDSIKKLAKEHTSNAYDLIFIGRYEEIKNPLRFIEIVSKVRRDFPNLKVAMLGGGSLEEDCKSLINEKKLQQVIDFKKFVDNPYPVLEHSKVFIMTSKSEGSPMVLLEALALGKPVIAPKIPGLETIINNQAGFLCNEDEEFVENISSLLNSENLYLTMSEAASKRANELCDMESYKELLHKVYCSA